MATRQRDRESLRARIRVAVDLAIGNSPAQAYRALEQVASESLAAGDEMVALYFQARAIADIKARRISDGFAAFDVALQAVRRLGEPALCARVLINAGTAATQDGDVALAIVHLEEALALSRVVERTTARNTLEKVRTLASTKPVSLVSLADAYYASGDLDRAAAALHEFHSVRSGNTGDLITAAAVGIPVGLLLGDEALLALSHDPNLLELAFARYEQWLCGPLVDAFCGYYERLGRRREHDALLMRAIEKLTSLDNGLVVGLRIARLGPPSSLPKIGALAAHQWPRGSGLFDAYRDLFEAVVAARRRQPAHGQERAARAALALAENRRPILQTAALQAAGDGAGADAVLRACGASQPSAVRWQGSPVHRLLATQLTPRESEVARLAAEGLTNRSIAGTLKISERTVHHHCEAIFGKLGIRSRWQLAGALNQLHDGPIAHAATR